MESDVNRRRPVSNLLGWEEAGLPLGMLDYFENVHYKDTGYRVWDLLNESNFHAAQLERIQKGKPLYEYGQFKGLWAELHMTALFERVFPYAPQGIVYDEFDNIIFPKTSTRNQLATGLQASNIIISDKKGALGRFLQNKFEIDILVALENERLGLPLPLVAQVKNRVPSMEEAVHDIGRNTVVYLSKIFDSYPDFLFAYCLPADRRYPKGVESVVGNFVESGGVLIYFDHDEEFTREMYDEYRLSLGF